MRLPCMTHDKRNDRLGLAVEERLQAICAARMHQLAHGLAFDLTNPLARDVELLADFFERVVRLRVDAVTHTQHLRFTRRQ
jgi:hypothetical protein